MGDLPGTAQAIRWDRGRAEIWPLAAAIHRLVFTLGDGRRIQPLAEAPWQSDAETTGDDSIPAHLRHLGGEWACVPFERTPADPVVHGFGTDNRWRPLSVAPHSTRWEIVYPANHPIERLTRTVAGVTGRPALAVTLNVLPRRDCVLPVGLHPILKLPEPGEAIGVEARFSYGKTFPVEFEAGVSRLAPNRRFRSLEALPLAAGGTADLAKLCHRTTEEAFQLFGIAGDLRVTYPRQRYALRLRWNAGDLPTCLFWLSAGGRQGKPWRGRFRGLGVEPLAAQFARQSGEGVIRGGHDFRAGQIWTTSYEIAAETLTEEDR